MTVEKFNFWTIFFFVIFSLTDKQNWDSLKSKITFPSKPEDKLSIKNSRHWVAHWFQFKLWATAQICNCSRPLKLTDLFAQYLLFFFSSTRNRSKKNVMSAMAAWSQSFDWRLLFGSWIMFCLEMWFGVYPTSCWAVQVLSWDTGWWEKILISCFSFFPFFSCFFNIFSPTFVCE